MALFLIANLVQDTSSSKQYNAGGVATYIQINRAFYVGGFADSDASNITDVAEAFVKTTIPVGTVHPTETLAKARFYRVDSVSHDRIVKVIVGFVWTDNGYAPTWTIESSSYTEVVETDVEYDDDGNLQPISLVYYPKWTHDGPNPANGDPYYEGNAVVHAERSRERFIYTKSLLDATQANTLRTAGKSYRNRVNADTWQGGDARTWRCTNVDVIFDPLKSQYLGRLEFVWREESWDSWARFRNDQFGVPSNLFRKSANIGGRDFDGNGVRKCKEYLTANFDDLLSIIP